MPALLVGVVLALAVALPARVGAAVVHRIVVDGAIGPAVAEFVGEAIERAQTEGAAALLIELDTPGGLLTSTRTIVKDLLTAPVPVIVYVAPSGAGAGSAGVFVHGGTSRRWRGRASGTHPVITRARTSRHDGRRSELTASFSGQSRQRGRNVSGRSRPCGRASVAADRRRSSGRRHGRPRPRRAARARRGRTVDVAGGASCPPTWTFDMRFSQRRAAVLGDQTSTCDARGCWDCTSSSRTGRRPAGRRRRHLPLLALMATQICRWLPGRWR
jgi:hypothetical protein